MDDLISRQDAIDAINKYACNTQRIYEAIKTLPSAQQEIIYCKDCSKYSGYCHHPETYSMYVDANHFCGYAERREEC